MAYTSGTATDYLDFLSTLATFAAANGWNILEQSSTRIYLRGEGVEGLDEIYVGAEAFGNATSGYYNFSLAGSISWRDGRALTAHPMSSGSRYLYLWNQPMKYWLVCHGGRIAGVVQIGTYYQSFYLGFTDISVVATPAQLPYPLYIGASGATSTNLYSTSGTGNAAFWSNRGDTGLIRLNAGDWISPQPTSFTEGQKANIYEGIDGAYLLDPIYLADPSRPANYGALDGFFRVSGRNQTAENIITVGGVNHIVIPDVYLSTVGDYVAMRLS